MSNDKNGISPFRNQEYLQSSSSKNNKYKKQVTAEDINEFAEAFSDDTTEKKGTDGKGFFASFKAKQEKAPKSAPSSQVKKPTVKKVSAPQSSAKPTEDEDLYAVQSVDIDAFLSSLGASPTPAKAEKISQKAEKNDDASHTKHFSLSKKPEKKKASERTQHFKLSDIARKEIKKSVPVPHKSADIINSVRVLSENKPADEAILEAAPPEYGSENPLDSVNPQKGEDIFTAVDKAVKRRKNPSSQGFTDNNLSAARKNAKRKKEEQTILTGKALRTSLIKNSKFNKVQLVFSLVMFFLTLIITVLPSFYSTGNALEPLFANGGRIYTLINILLLVPIVIVFFKKYASAVKSIVELRPNSDTVLLLVTLFVLVHDISAAVLHTSGLNGIKSYTLCAVFAAGVSALGDLFRNQTALRSLMTIMKAKSLQSVQPVENKADANSLASGITEKGEPNILYCAEVETGDNLTAGIGASKFENKYITYGTAAVLLSGLILSLIIYFKSRDGGLFLSTLLSCICLCTPLMSGTVRDINGYFENLRLNKLGAAATEHEGVRSVGKADAVAMDISDIFTAEVSRFRLVPGVHMEPNDAATFASSVTIGAKSLTGKCFSDFIKQLGIELPVAENVQYEENLGYSAWVDNKRVLVGNREMLIQHSIPVPSEKEEARYRKNKFVMYLVIEGQLTATFLVNYKVLSSIKKLSKDFNKTGLVLMLTSKEPCLSHIEIAKRLGLDAAGVKVLSTKGCGIINEYRSNKAMRISSGLVCTEKSRNLFPLVVGAHRLYVSDKFLFLIHLLGQGIGFLLLVLSYALNMPLFFNPFTIVLLHLLWSVGAYFLCTRRSRS